MVLWKIFVLALLGTALGALPQAPPLSPGGDN
jgi:hypothetical protein